MSVLLLHPAPGISLHTPPFSQMDPPSPLGISLLRTCQVSPTSFEPQELSASLLHVMAFVCFQFHLLSLIRRHYGLLCVPAPGKAPGTPQNKEAPNKSWHSYSIQEVLN